jgi:hypothetical protein
MPMPLHEHVFRGLAIEVAADFVERCGETALAAAEAAAAAAGLLKDQPATVLFNAVLVILAQQKRPTDGAPA